MFVSDACALNDAGHLTVGGADTVELAERFGTPLYVMDEEKIRRNCRDFTSAINKYFHGNGLAYYASKALCCKAICRVAAEEGMGLDVVSGGELYTALEAGFPPQRIAFHGNNKSEEEIFLGVEAGVGRFMVDNADELEALDACAAKLNKTVCIHLRLSPGVDAHVHDFIKTGKIDSKFGVAIQTGQAMELIRLALQKKHVQLTGLHCHIGSQIFSEEPFVLATQVMIRFMAEVRAQTGLLLQELTLGGGFGVRYVPADDPKPLDVYMQAISSALETTCSDTDLPVPALFFEPGRYIVAAAGVTLYKVGCVKEIPGYRSYTLVDGGMPDNPRYILYGAEYDVTVANKASLPKNYLTTLAGKCCESGDLIQENILLQKPQRGDIVAVLTTGAYNYSMASHYNRLPNPAMVLVRNGEAKPAIRRETNQDLLRNDL